MDSNYFNINLIKVMKEIIEKLFLFYVELISFPGAKDKIHL